MPDFFAGVRGALPEDEAAVYALLKMLHAENGIFPMDEAKVLATIRAATHRKGGIIGVIDAEDGRGGIEATVGLRLETLWYAEAWWLVELWAFVHPDCRRSTHAKRLIEWSKWCSDRLGVDMLMGVISNQRTEAKVRLYRRQLPYAGGFFFHKHANGAGPAA